MKVLFVFAFLVSVAVGIPSLPVYLDFLASLSANETFAKTYADYADKRRELVNEKYFPQGNDVLGVPTYSCATLGARSTAPPSNVNALRVNDIDVVAAMGDSLTAGFGAGAHSLVELTLEYRGLAFPIGGDGDLKYSATLPNIVNQYSSLLVGASTRVSPVWYTAFSQLNVAVSGARADNLTTQAHELVKRMKADSRIDLQKDWKLVTIFVGSNDLCHYCEDTTRYSPSAYKASLKSSIDVIHAALPRTLVQIVSPSHVTQLLEVNKVSSYCTQMHKIACPCVTNPSVPAIQEQYHTEARALQKEYEGIDDFAVVTQTFMENSKVPVDSNGESDLSFYAPDCFHFSHWAHSLVARGLFNNMMEPVGSKATEYDTANLKLACPDQACPLIRTPANSANCAKFLAKTSQLRLDPISPTAAKTGLKATNLAAALPQTINLVDHRTGHSFVMMCIGVALGMIVGVILGSMWYNGLCAGRTMQARRLTEKTPLLSAPNGRGEEAGDTNYVQIY